MSLGRYVCPLVAVAGFTPDMITYCSMHVSNLGLVQWVNAGVLMGLMQRGVFGDPRNIKVAQQLRIATLRFREWCSLHGIEQSQPIITQGMLFRDPPELTLKAYHGRIFVSFLAALCHGLINDRATNDDDELLLWLEVSRSLAQWHSKLEDCDRYLLREDALELRRIGNRFLHVYKILAHRAAAAGSQCFPLRPKHHAFQELNAMMIRQLYCCRFKHCFKDEDMMKIIKALCRKCHKNLLELRVLARLLLRYKYCTPDASR